MTSRFPGDGGRGDVAGRVPWNATYVVAALLILGAGIAERALLYVRSMPTNSDEALSVLMARATAHGHLPLFLWGQDFGGAVVVYPLTILVRLFPGSLLADRLITMVLGAVAAALGGMIATRLAGAAAGLVTGAVLWLWPIFFVNWSMHEYLYYVPVVVLGLLGMLLAVRSWQWPRSSWIPVVVGVAGGLSFWMNPQMVTFVPPILLGLLWVRENRFRRAVLAAVGAIVAVSPWLVFNLRHHFVSLNAGALNQHATYLSRLHELLRDGGAVALGLETEGGTWLGGWAHPVYDAAVVVSVVLVITTLVSWRRLGGPPPIDIVGVVLYPFLYALSPAAPGYDTVIVRYFFFAWPWVALLAGRLVVILLMLRRRASEVARPARMATAAIAIVGSFALASVAVDMVQSAPRATPPPGMTAAGFNFRVASDQLEAAGTTRVFTDYWLAYMLDKASDGGVVATPSDPLDVRYTPWDREVHDAAHPAWLFVRSSVKYRAFMAWLASQHISFRAEPAAGFVVVIPSTHITPSDVPVTAYRVPGENY